jgi:Amt family ammonium transporter
MDKQQIVSFINENMFGIWFLIGAALVFWMQAGFAMVETGFTRAKNAGNILMKNLMDFCIGTVMFILIGFSLLLGEDVLGFIGKPGFDIFTSYANFDFSNFVFNLVFCATTATIVSGAMAERTKFLSYCIYSAVISALIYPIEAHWIWGGGWLSQLGFHDFAGSCAIHMVGGISALIGAAMLGPRIGKFSKDKSGKITKVNAFPGHNLPLGCLGCFILWFGWYGFNIAPSFGDMLRKPARQRICHPDPRPGVNRRATEMSRSETSRRCHADVFALVFRQFDKLVQHKRLARPRRTGQKRALSREQNLQC